MLKFLAATPSPGHERRGGRRAFLHHLPHKMATVAVAAVVLLLALFQSSPKAEANEPPNIVFILADDMDEDSSKMREKQGEKQHFLVSLHDLRTTGDSFKFRLISGG